MVSRLLDELLAELERAFEDPRDEAVRLHVWLYARREHLAELRKLAALAEQAR